MRLIVVTLLLVATALTACGRRGPLEAPPAQQSLAGPDAKPVTLLR